MCEALELPKKAETFLETLNTKVCAIENLTMDSHVKFGIYLSFRSFSLS